MYNKSKTVEGGWSWKKKKIKSERGI